MEIGYANVFVSDLERAVGFYRDVLGLPLEFGDGAHGYASFRAGAFRLGLAVADAGDGQWIGRHTGLGFVTKDLVADHARLVAAGVTFASPPERQPWGGFIALLQDPDGNVFYLDEVSAVHGA
ncbi:MAG: VOC family protein [Myxococcota bacterium]